MSTNSVTLSYDVLLRIFELASEDDIVELDKQSNEIQPWSTSHSSDSINYSLVCIDWRVPAQMALFKSVVIVGSISAILFQMTLAKRPEFSRQVRRLIVSLTDEQQHDYNPIYLATGEILARSGEDKGQASTSFDLVRVIDACVSLRHLRVEPLHHLVRESLLAAVSSKPLISLIITPHISPIIESSTINSVFRPNDLPLLFSSTLKHLYVDYHLNPILLVANTYFHTFHCNTLTTLILNTNVECIHILPLLALSASTLVSLHLTTCADDYHNPDILAVDYISKWSLLFPILERLYLCPAPPYFATLLNQFQNLHFFATVTFESHINYVANLPASLRHFVLHDASGTVDEEAWHKLLWSLKAATNSEKLLLATMVDSNSVAEELFFGLLTVERVSSFTVNEFFDCC